MQNGPSAADERVSPRTPSALAIGFHEASRNFTKPHLGSYVRRSSVVHVRRPTAPAWREGDRWMTHLSSYELPAVPHGIPVPAYLRGFQTLDAETSMPTLPVQGRIPRWL